jgi:hypothetical protein
MRSTSRTVVIAACMAIALAMMQESLLEGQCVWGCREISGSIQGYSPTPNVGWEYQYPYKKAGWWVGTMNRNYAGTVDNQYRVASSVNSPCPTPGEAGITPGRGQWNLATCSATCTPGS